MKSTNKQQKHTFFLPVLIPVLIFVIIFLLSIQTGFAQNSEREEANLTIQKINSVPAFDTGELDMDDIIDIMFDLTGTLDAIYKNRIIVGDIEILLTNRHLISKVRQGDYVGVKTGEQNQVLLIKKIQNRD